VPEKKKVLIVDDEKAITDTFVMIFELQGYEAKPAYSAEEALSLLDQWKPALAIIDVMLPKMNGIDLAIAMESLCPAVRVLLISGQTATADLLAGYGEQGRKFAILAKPIPVHDLLEHTARLEALN
jgi:DNA-binding response OmpR family regulator